MNKEKMETVVPMIAAVFLSAFLLVILLLVFALAGPWNEKMLEKAMIQSGFKQQSVERFQEEWNTSLEEMGLSSNFGKELVESRRLYAVFGKNNTENNWDFKENLKIELKAYLKEEGIEKNQGITSAITQFINENSRVYESYLYPVFLKRISLLRKETIKPMIFIMSVSFLCTAISVYYLIQSSPFQHRGIRFISLSLMSAVICLAGGVFFLYVKMGNWIAAVEPVFYQNLLYQCRRNYMQTGMVIMIVAAGIFVLLQVLEKGLKNNGK